VPRELKPLLAVPTTAGTGSETTGVAVFDDTTLGVKTGISSRRLKPALAFLDPEHTRTVPPQVAASCGLDVLCHAVESYTALPYTARSRPARPALRPPYQGANPISDVWALQALRLLSTYFLRAVRDAGDDEARGQMLLAASYAGVGFGTAGVHIPHAMAYPVAGNVRDYRPAGYGTDHALVPHGVSVILNASAAFRLTAPAHPARHLEAAAALGADTARVSADDAGRVLGDRIQWFMDRLGVPMRLRDVGYTSADVPTLVRGALLQQRLLTLAPRPVTGDDMARLFEASM
jgi:hydroxyacid-oxoacid transhydrogenase